MTGGRRGPVLEAKPVNAKEILSHLHDHRSVRRFRPAWVDASSRLEAAPGRKDPEKLRLFVERARGALAP